MTETDEEFIERMKLHCSTQGDIVRIGQTNMDRIFAIVDGSAKAADELQEELSIWKSVFPDIAPQSVQPDRSLLEVEITRLRAALREARAETLEEAAKMAKVAWLTYPLCNIADADAMCGMCEDLSDAIRALKDKP